MAIASRTYLQLCEAVADRLGALKQGTATSGTSTTLVAANYPFITSRTNESVKEYEGDQLYATAATSPFAPSPVEIAAYAPSTGTFTSSISFTTNPDSSDTFDIFRNGIVIADLKTAVNTALRKLEFENLYPLTLLPDGDCDYTDATTYWGSASSATASKVQILDATVKDTPNILRGRYALRVLNSGANGYLPTDGLAVVGGDTYFVQARVRADVGTGTLIAYDSTNSANISTESWAYRGWGTLNFSFTIPATCELLTLRLQGTGASDDVYWDDICLLRVGSREIALPDWVVEEGQVLEVYHGTQNDRADMDTYSPLRGCYLIPDQFNPLSNWKLQLPFGMNGPVWFKGRRTYPTLSADADTTICDRDLVELMATRELLKILVSRIEGDDTRGWRVQLKETEHDLRQYTYTYGGSQARIDRGSLMGTPVSVVGF